MVDISHIRRTTDFCHRLLRTVWALLCLVPESKVLRHYVNNRLRAYSYLQRQHCLFAIYYQEKNTIFFMKVSSLAIMRDKNLGSVFSMFSRGYIMINKQYSVMQSKKKYIMCANFLNKHLHVVEKSYSK